MMKNKMKISVIFKLQRALKTIVFICIVSLNLPAQSLDVTPFFPEMPDARVGFPYTTFGFRLSDGSNPNSWGWVPIGAPNIALTRLQINVNTGVVEFQFGFTQIGGAANTLYRFTVTARNLAGDPIASKPYSLFVRSNPVTICSLRKEYAIVIDLSGSMNIDTDPGAAIETRWTQLQEALTVFLPTLDDLCSATDRFKVIYFNGTTTHSLPVAAPFYYNFGGPGATYWNNSVNIRNDLLSESPSGWTPLGAGVRDPIDNFFDPAASRTIVLFSDGWQNQLPMYDPVTEMIPTEPPGGTVINFLTSHAGIKVFSIGVAGCDKTTLQKIARPDGWFAQADIMTTIALNTAFTESIVESQKDCSPRIIDYRVGKMGGDAVPVEQRFHLNRLVDQLLVRATALDGRIFGQSWSLYKDSILVPVDPTFDDPTLRYSISLPFRMPDGTFLDEGGEWKLVFKGSESADYEFVVIAEDKYIRTDMNIADGALLYAGDVIPVEVNVSLAGAPIDSASVLAVLLRPGDDLGDLAARTNIDRSVSDPTDTTNIGVAKIDALLSDSSFLAKLKADSNLLVLTNAGNGIYRGNFTQNNLAGTYRVIALIDGKTQGLGQYEGWETKYVLLDFSRPEDIQLNSSTPVSLNKDIKNRYALVIKPSNKFNRLLGPGQSHRVRMKGNITGVNAQIIDQLDGSYMIIIPVTSAGEIVTLWVGDQTKPVYVGQLSEISGRRGFGLSLHAGVSLPLSNLSPTYTSGIYGEIDLSYRFNSHWSMEAIGGYYGFGNNFNITGGSLFGIYTVPGLFGGRWNLHFAGGLGAFKPKNQDLTFGFGLKTGVGLRINQHLEADLELAYHGLPGPGYAFGTAGVGVHYFF